MKNKFIPYIVVFILLGAAFSVFLKFVPSFGIASEPVSINKIGTTGGKAGSTKAKAPKRCVDIKTRFTKDMELCASCKNPRWVLQGYSSVRVCD